MDSITRDYRLKATELYIRTAKAEFDYHTNRVKQLFEGSTLVGSEQPTNDPESIKSFHIFLRVHQHHTSALAEANVIFLEERTVKDAPDPPISVPELRAMTGPIQAIVQLNKN
jgi:hypothetical protein